MKKNNAHRLSTGLINFGGKRFRIKDIVLNMIFPIVSTIGLSING